MLGPDRRAGSRGTVSAEAVAAPSVTARAPRSGSRVVVVLALVWRLACGCFACPTASSELSKFLDEQPLGVTLCAAVTGNYVPGSRASRSLRDTGSSPRQSTRR